MVAYSFGLKLYYCVGVRSFNIEMETKKVTIIGDVTPLGVLASVSKVKSAQLWPSTTSSSRPTFP
jgi:hypothetical protein